MLKDIAEGKPAPEGWGKGFPLPLHLHWYWEAFWELSNDRNIGNVAGPIPFTAINDYASRYKIEPLDLFERFRAVIRAMDRVHGRLIADKTGTSQQGTPQGTPETAVPVNDVQGVSAVLGRLAARAATVYGEANEEEPSDGN